MRKEIENWWKQSDRDLETAEYNLVGKRYEASVFFCHQAVEKALKALLMEKEKVPDISTHSLLVLGKKVGLPSELHSFLMELAPQYVLTRYPDASNEAPFELFDEKRAEYVFGKAEEVIVWIKKQLK